MLAQCPKFESGTTGIDAELGHDRHAALAAHFDGDDSLLDLMDDDEADAVRWAAEYIRMHAPMMDHPIAFEVSLNPTGPNFEPLFPNGGTADAICGNHLFDLKSRHRDYWPQMAAYVLGWLETSEHTEVNVHILFGALRRAETRRLNHESALALVMPIIERAKDPDSLPTPCDYCNWCAKSLMCPALTEPAKTVAAGYSDGALDITNWHPSEMDNPDQIALGLTIWRRILEPWGKSMEFHAKEAAIKQGLKLPGYEVQDRKGKRVCINVQRAFELSGVEPSQFLRACSIRWGKSKSNPNLLGLEQVYAEAKGISQSAAKRGLKKTLAEVVIQPVHQTLKSTKFTDDDSAESEE